MTDEKVLKSWQELHDQILAALLKCGSDRDVEDFENWFEQEPKVTPVTIILHASVGLDGLKVGYLGADDVVDRLMCAMTNVGRGD
ncbi:hypothetical protein K3720_04420 [Leisingera caerulea]|uniref:hypothetical protein n=1 Tax=Leisingera caerulea TaxID=506591 RepID=UPI0021A48867|nr:hypothetical protein [Leisingera caerulea]UWQ50658.1 hypothetical protein K3720_04420 [Leisingera caerulea]